MRRAHVIVLLSLVASIGVGLSSVASAAPPDTSSTVLDGDRDVPGPGDPNGVGRAVVSPRPAESEVCVSSTVGVIPAAVSPCRRCRRPQLGATLDLMRPRVGP